MPGPVAKSASTRVRRNKTTTRAVLRPVKNPKVPGLPAPIKWYEPVRQWWKRAWSSPMVPEWTESDKDAMFLAARLMQQFWDPDTSASVRVSTAAEIRQILSQCGLTPMSRRSLQWEVERGESAAERTTQRRQASSKAAAMQATPAPDPRVTRLHAVG
ncbi:hypothetical protein [Mycobacterium canetti]|uniref:phage terminase small subunit n=1 Tax=Mycobacterium canetti TaxID=78331 RepID=UPI0012F6E170|nr:hypothetical protein [Mycobacterium canetti]